MANSFPRQTHENRNQTERRSQLLKAGGNMQMQLHTQTHISGHKQAHIK